MPNAAAAAAAALLRELFSVQALDARIQPVAHKRAKDKAKATPSRWQSWEFRCYYAAFALVVPLMFYTAMGASNESNVENYHKFERLLSPGWLLGRKVDNSDAQYRFFRDNFTLLVALMVGHVLVKRLVVASLHVPKLTFDACFGVLFLFVAHGFNSLRILAHALAMFAFAHAGRRHRRCATFATWTYGIATLFINDNFRNYPLGNILPFLAPLDSFPFKGIIARWDVFFNFTLLRIISYNLDYLERWDNQFTTLSQTTTIPTEQAQPGNDADADDIIIAQQPAKPAASSSSSSSPPLQTIAEDSVSEMLTNERTRLVAPHHIQEYNLANFLAYICYTPLFIAGPIVTFNDYVFQSQNTLPSINRKRIMSYAIRLALTILTMEFILHFIYVVAVSKTKAWTNDSPFQISMIGLFNLNVIYLKLLIPWRLFRLWAMLDGIDAPENMIRLVDNNYSALAFWRAWHRSYNKWVVRYIYIPLGGSNNRILTSLAVFSFVAIWHDIQLKLLLWGWLIVLFLIPEMVTTEYFKPYRNASWYRHACALGAIVNIWMMMVANLFGFCLGSDGTRALLRDMFSTSSGLSFFVIASACLFIAVQIMFEIREDEKRRGIYLKC